MEIRLFSEGWFSKKEAPSPHQEDIDAFHHHLRQVHEYARKLKDSGHHVEVDYDNAHVVRHDDRRKTGTIFFNHAHGGRIKVQVSKKVPLRPFDRK